MDPLGLEDAPAENDLPQGSTERREGHDARRLAEARGAFAACMLALPEGLRDEVLAGDESGPQDWSGWPLARLDRCFERLVSLAGTSAEPEVARLVRRARTQHETIARARNAIVVGNLGLVAHVARQFESQRLPFVDLFQEGTIGLLTAVERFDWRRGYRFSTYAYWWIRQAISSSVAEESTFIRLSDHTRAKLRRCQRVAHEIGASLGWSSDWHAVARRAGLPLHKLHELITLAREPFSLDAGVTDDDDDLLRQIPDPRSVDPLQRALDREERANVLAALHRLEPREKTILRHRYGIDDEPTYTLAELGRMLKLTRERVRQIERCALRKILRDTPGPGSSQPA